MKADAHVIKSLFRKFLGDREDLLAGGSRSLP